MAETETVLLVEPLGGLSGDMFLGAFIDLGLPRELLRENLAAVGLGSGFGFERSIVSRHGIAAVKVDFPVRAGAGPAPSTLAGIEKLLKDAAGLPASVKAVSREIFRLLAGAEARVHGMSPETVHFHEIGDYDTLADVVGAATALDYFAPRCLCLSPVPLGCGFVDAVHGRLPLPVPAVARLLKGIEVVATSIPHELVTPTGAAICRYLVDNLSAVSRPARFRLRGFGYGAGNRDLAARPNLLRLGLTEMVAVNPEDSRSTPFAREPVVLLETLLDDLSPEKCAAVADHLRTLDTLEVIVRPVQMKKGRLGFEFQVMVRPEAEAGIVAEIIRQTPTLGIRRQEIERYRLERETVEFATSFGNLHGKLARDLTGRVCNFKLEHDELVERARECNLTPSRLELLAAAEIVKQLDDKIDTRD